MINNKSFQSIKISNEITNFMIIPDIIELIKKLNEKLNFKIDEDIIISIKYGKRIVINCENSNLKKIQIDDFIEIADYNPVKKLFLIIGKHEPDFNMTFHWIIQNARREKNVLIQLKTNLLTNEKKIKDDSIEIAKDILLKFRDSNIVFTEKYGIFIIGNSLNEIQNIINKLIEEVK